MRSLWRTATTRARYRDSLALDASSSPKISGSGHAGCGSCAMRPVVVTAEPSMSSACTSSMRPRDANSVASAASPWARIRSANWPYRRAASRASECASASNSSGDRMAGGGTKSDERCIVQSPKPRRGGPNIAVKHHSCRVFRSRCAERAVFRRLWPVLVCLALVVAALSNAHADPGLAQFIARAQPADVFPDAERIGSIEGQPPAAPAFKGGRLLGYVYLNSDVVNSTGYSGKPIRILIAVDFRGRIVAAKLVEQHEPIVLIGIPAAKLTAFIRGYIGRTIGEAPEQPSAGLPADIISGATVTTMVIGDSITRSAIRVAQSRRLGTGLPALAPTAPADRKAVDTTKRAIEDWPSLLGDGS